jgi:hypothetical protein
MSPTQQKFFSVSTFVLQVKKCPNKKLVDVQMCFCSSSKKPHKQNICFLLPKPGCVAAGLKDGSAGGGGGDAMCRLWKLYISIQVFKLLLVTVILGVHDL